MGQPPIDGAACTVTVRDVERAVRFYVDALGMRLRASHSGRVSDWAEVEGYGLRVVLLGSDRPPRAGAPGRSAPTHVSIGFEVADLDTAILALRERGIELSPEIAEDAESRVVRFTDLDGTPLFLRERRR